MYVGYATNAQQKQDIGRLWPSPIRKFVDTLENVPKGSTVVVYSLRDFNVGVIRLHELGQRYTIYSCETQPDDSLKFYADIERNARRHRSRLGAERRRKAGKKLGPRRMVDRLTDSKRQELEKEIADPDTPLSATVKKFKIDRRALVRAFENELKVLGKI